MALGGANGISGGSVGLFAQLKGKMHWHHARQGVLAQNVANADTPNFRGKDFKAYSPSGSFDLQMTMKPVSTSSGHMSLSAPMENAPRARSFTGYETTPYNNSVTAEQEMLKVTQNQLDYQIASTVYQKNLGLIKMAIRR
jgi:flagellar basal-body rod protein FlgB